MGSFSVETTVRNWQNRFLPPDEQGEEVTCEALVDTGAVQMALPTELIEKLRLIEVGSIRPETADGGLHNFRVMGMAEVEVQGRSCRVQVIELPRGSRPLLGAVPLEEMDWHISSADSRLVPNPRWPERPTVPLM